MRKKGSKKWSIEEIDRLKQIMTRYTVDIEGCKYAAQELGRPFQGVCSKWSDIKPNKKVINKKTDYVDALCKNLSANPGNISYALKKTAKDVGKSANYIRTQYYSKKDSPLYRDNISTCFTMISKDKMSSNSKNFNTATKTTKQKVKQLIAQLLGIRKEDL